MDEELNELELRFSEQVKLFKEEMKVAQDKVSEAIKETVKISEKYGMSFRGAANIRQNYSPKTMEEKWPGLDFDWASDMLGCYSDGYGYGWDHSAIC